LWTQFAFYCGKIILAPLYIILRPLHITLPLSRHITFSLFDIPSSLVLYTSSLNLYGSVFFSSSQFFFHVSHTVKARHWTLHWVYHISAFKLHFNFIFLFNDNIYNEVTYFKISRHKFCAHFCSPLRQ
jgi:hypothetical protein